MSGGPSPATAGSPAPTASQSDTATSAGGRLPALDGLRGVAIALVLLYHLTGMSQPWASSSAVDRALWKLSGTGWAGVDLFFVLSGFLITGILYDSKGVATHYFRSFFARRVLRIVPVYYALLVLLTFALPVLLPSARSSAEGVWHNLAWYGTFTLNIRTAFGHGFQPDLFFTSHLWSLSVEEQFYLVWPFVVLALSRRALLATCLAAIVGALAIRVALDVGGARGTAGYYLMPSRMDGLAIGALIALVIRERDVLRRAVSWLPALAVLAVAGLFAVEIGETAGIPPFDRWVMTVGLSFLSLLFGCVLLAVVAAPPGAPLRRILSHAGLAGLGRYSYAIYLFHLPVATILWQRTHLAAHVPSLFGSTLPGIAAFTITGALISCALAWLSWNLIEQQCLKLKRYFPYSGSGPGETRAVRVPAAPMEPSPVRTG